MSILFLTQVTTPIIKWLAWVLGLIMNLLFQFTSLFGIENIGICIILFTIITNLILLPLTIKQQKSSKLMSYIQPEIKAIQTKYQGKTDQQSQMRMQAETQAVYDKYGTSMFGGCGTLIIQLPILLMLYQVIYHIPGYVPQVKAVLEPAAQAMHQYGDIYPAIQKIAEAVKLTQSKAIDYQNIDCIIDLLYKLNSAQWVELEGIFPSIAVSLRTAAAGIAKMNQFLGLNLAEAPWQGFKPNWAWLIPILSGLTQWISTKLMTKTQPQMEDDSTGQSMKMMNNLMPLMSVFFCFTLPSCIGVYWIASSLFRMIQQIFINKWLDKVNVEDMIQANLEKVNKKRAKKGLPPKTIDKSAQKQAEKEARRAEFEEQKKAENKEKSDKQVIDSTQYYNLNARPNSLTAKANMVAMYDQREQDRRRGKKTKPVTTPEPAKTTDNKEGE